GVAGSRGHTSGADHDDADRSAGEDSGTDRGSTHGNGKGPKKDKGDGDTSGQSHSTHSNGPNLGPLLWGLCDCPDVSPSPLSFFGPFPFPWVLPLSVPLSSPADRSASSWSAPEVCPRLPATP